MAIEIYPRILTGSVVKSSAAERRTFLGDPRWHLEPTMLEAATATEDTFDAAVSALVMAEHSEELQELTPAEDHQTLLEGAIWFPQSAPVALAQPADRAGPILTDRFEKALVFSAHLHQDQERKGSNVPYVGHLLGVASIVIEEGGDEDQAIAALLHDAVEDQGGPPILDNIRKRFGARVATIVEGCTDAVSNPKPPWRPRKEQYLDHLRTASRDILLVSLADKLFNARAILADHQRVGSAVWQRFSGGRDGQLWYYRSLADGFLQLGDKVPVRLARELDRVVTEIEDQAEQESSANAAPT